MSYSRSGLLIVLFVLTSALLTCAMTSSQVRRKRGDDPDPLETVVEHLSQQVSSLSAQLTQQSNECKAEIAALKAKTATLDQTVAFHAWGSSNPVQALGHATIILNHASTNIGNAYDTTTGIFTAPVSGLYDFRASILSYDTSSKIYIHGSIFVDNTIQAIAIADSRHGYFAQSTMQAVVHVRAGQKVSLKNTDATTSQYYDSNGLPYTTFSGFLVKAD